jgi:hypothetical protein
MAAATYNLTGAYAIERGASYSYTFDLATSSGEYPISGYSFSGVLRRGWDGELGPSFTPEILSATSGIVNMSLSASQTLSLTKDSYSHEVYGYPLSGLSLRILEGSVEVLGGSFE